MPASLSKGEGRRSTSFRISHLEKEADMASRHIEKVAGAFGEIRQAMDQIVVGHGELKDALVVALFKRALGVRGGHVLVFGPPGTGKTWTVKGLVQILRGMGAQVPYERVQGNPDLTPSDFLFRRTVEYEGGSPRFVWALQKIGSFVAKEDGVLHPRLLLARHPPAPQSGPISLSALKRFYGPRSTSIARSVMVRLVIYQGRDRVLMV